MQDRGTAAFKHAIRRGCFGVAAGHEKVVFAPKKRQNRRLVHWHRHTPTWYRQQVRPVGTGGTARIWQLLREPHNWFINGAVSIRQALLYCYKYTCHSCSNRFFTDLLKWRGKIAAILDRASWNKSGKMKQFLADNEERIDYRYFPVGWPQLNPTEGFWNVLKRNSLMHKHYDSVHERVGRALYFLQNLRINIDCETCIFRDPKPIANLF